MLFFLILTKEYILHTQTLLLSFSHTHTDTSACGLKQAEPLIHENRKKRFTRGWRNMIPLTLPARPNACTHNRSLERQQKLNKSEACRLLKKTPLKGEHPILFYQLY